MRDAARWMGWVLLVPLLGWAAPGQEDAEQPAAAREEVIIVVTPEYADTDQPLLVVPRSMSPMEIPLEDNEGALRESYGQSRPDPRGQRIPLRQSFSPELKGSVMEQ
jgi:hypothetical protein